MTTGFPPSTLSHHAKERLKERFLISEDDFLYLLNMGQGKKIGVSKETHIAHRLFWSPDDKALLVAIQDVVDGGILTVLTLEMYQKYYADNITENRIASVINKMIVSGFAPAHLWKPGIPGEYVIVYAQMKDGNILTLGRKNNGINSCHLSSMGKNPDFWIWVAERMRQRDCSLDALELVTARFSYGDAEYVPYACA